MSSRAYNRAVSRRKALNRRQLARNIYPYDEHDYYDNLHQYSTNKIHCSCPVCSAKTRNKGRRDRKNYSRSLNYKATDLRKLMTMDADEEDTLGNKTPKRYTKNW